MSTKRLMVLSGLIAPLLAYVVTTFWHAYGGYDGQHCAGLLDASWNCSEFEYYLDWLLNPISITALAFFYVVSAVVTPTILWACNKYNNRL